MGFDVSKDRFGYAGGFEAISGGRAAPKAFLKSIGKYSAGSTSTTPPTDSTGATLIAISVHANSTDSTSAISDSKGNVWIPLTPRFTGGVPYWFTRLFYCINPIVGSGHTFTNNIPGASVQDITAMLFGGKFSTFIGESGSSAGTSATTIQPGNIVNPAPPALFVTVTMNPSASGPTVDSGFVVALAAQYQGPPAYKISSTSENPTWTTTTDAYGLGAVMAAFR